MIIHIRSNNIIVIILQVRDKWFLGRMILVACEVREEEHQLLHKLKREMLTVK